MPPTANAGSQRAPRAAKACTSCHSRKVRCDVLEIGQPCTSCQNHGFECVLSKRKRRRQRNEEAESNTIPRKHAKPYPQSLPENVLHQVPHFSFLQEFIPSIRISQSASCPREVMLPILAHDMSSSPHSEPSTSSVKES